jgi:hypothetical protein
VKTTHIPIGREPAANPLETAIRIPLTRRELLKGSGVLIGTLAASSTLAMLAPSRVWALELQRFSSHEGNVLLAFTRTLFPHPTLDDAVYALVLKDLDAKASGDPEVRRRIADGVRQLDSSSPKKDWTQRAPEDQVKDAAALGGSPFFETVRSTAVVSLYSNPLAYRHFGYGASEGDGGYLYKGFDSLAWLPNPPAEASGPIPSDS